MTLNVQKQYARRIQQLPIQTMMPRRQAPRFQRRKKEFHGTCQIAPTFRNCTPESKDKNKEFFVRKKEQLLESQKNMMHVTQTINEKATEASYLVSYRIAQAGEAHTIAENLIKPCVLDITKCMLDEKSAKHLSTVPLSNDTVSRRIHDLASYVKQELVTRLQKTRFALQMDESTDVAGLAILLVIVRYPYESSFEEDMLMCSPLPTNTTGEEILIK
ncbi:Zinc finger BED domain-containing protein 5 [Eumeta japonica]|uniref:Zinc finger BED domain-containing protein 5 n=1 Tax=Eumeta variegata TaxID=151549 RepID=A0A4C1SWM0_EUMVA|nr:Zinc finger BED domain-containing protein 5 [Eumeta japonica]